MLWSRDNFFEVTMSWPRVVKSWPRDPRLREQHPFLVTTTSYVEGMTFYLWPPV